MKKLILTLFITLFSILASWGQNIAELKQKAEQGDANAQNNLGQCYRKGKGVKWTWYLKYIFVGSWVLKKILEK